jgi:hypothetical protein
VSVDNTLRDVDHALVVAGSRDGVGQGQLENWMWRQGGDLLQQRDRVAMSPFVPIQLDERQECGGLREGRLRRDPVR